MNYSPDLELCILNWQSTIAYSITLAVLVSFIWLFASNFPNSLLISLIFKVLLPSVCTIAFTSAAVFSAIRRPEELEVGGKIGTSF